VTSVSVVSLLELVHWFVCRKVIKIPVLLPKQTIHQLDKLKLRRDYHGQNCSDSLTAVY